MKFLVGTKKEIVIISFNCNNGGGEDFKIFGSRIKLMNEIEFLKITVKFGFMKVNCNIS